MSEDATYREPLAFFRKHWNGDYSLGRSYWINTFLVSLVAPTLALILLPALQELPARYSSAAVLGLTVLGLAVWTWALSGTWASANKHVQRGGRQGWATAAKVAIVLGILKTVGDVGNLGGVLAEHWRMVLGEQPGPQYSIQVTADGKAVMLKGGINDGAADALAKTLEMAPAVNTIVFNSAGGWVREGRRLANIISKHRLRTYVEGECSSACTIAFLAGIDRAADPDARIGFHQFRSVGGAGEDAMVRSVYTQAGISSNFISKILSTPNSETWYPAHDELLEANIINRRIFGGETASVASRLTTRDAVISELKKESSLNALAQRYPVEFENVVDETWTMIQQRKTDAEVYTAARTRMMQSYDKLRPLAPDDMLLAWNRLILDQAIALSTKSAEACAEIVFPSGKASNAAALIPPELAQREVDLITGVIVSAHVKNRAQVDPEVAQRVLGGALRQLSERHRQIVIFPNIRLAANSEELCSAAIAYFKAIDSLEPTNRRIALRSTLGTPN